MGANIAEGIAKEELSEAVIGECGQMCERLCRAA